MSNHYIKKCRVCDKIITQCRCPAKDKKVILTVCDECLKNNCKEEETLVNFVDNGDDLTII